MFRSIVTFNKYDLINKKARIKEQFQYWLFVQVATLFMIKQGTKVLPTVLWATWPVMSPMCLASQYLTNHHYGSQVVS